MTAPDHGTRAIRRIDRDLGYLWSLLLGAAMVFVGLLGFVPNPLVGEPSGGWGTPLSLTGDARNIIHLITGALLLYGALGLTAHRRGALLMAVGAIQVVLFLVGLLSGDLLGVVRYHVSLLDQLVLLVIALANLGVGLLASERSWTLSRRP